MPLPEMLERQLGQKWNREREAAKNASPVCPPVDPNLIAHLRMMFQKPSEAKPGHPQLGQLLIVQYGVEKVIDYLTRAHDFQSEEARKKHAI